MIRIATVGYLNAEPLVSGLDTARYDIQADIPARVAEALNNGTADVALTPVVAALADAEFRIVGGIAIGSEGPVHSVVLVAETEPEEWDEIVLDGESRTSAILTRVLLKGPLGERCKARVQEVAPGVGVERARGRTAALVIGDAAMHLPDRLTVRLDLGQLWTDWTGLPFVFAVWAGRPELSATVRNDLRESAAIGLAEITTRYQGAERDYLLNNIRYELDERALMGLRRFAALAHSAGLVGSSDVVLYGPVDRVVEREGSLQGILERGALGEELTLGDLETCAEDARLSDLVAAAGLRSPAPDGPSVRFTQRVQVASTPEQVAVAVQLARSRGADILQIEGMEALSQEQVSARLGSLPTEWRGHYVVSGEETLATLTRAWSISREELMHWLSHIGFYGVTGVTPTKAAGWIDPARKNGLMVSFRVSVKPSEDTLDLLLSIQVIRELLNGAPRLVGLEIAHSVDGSRGSSAVEGLKAQALCRLAFPVDISIGLDSQGWGPVVTVAALRMGASELGPVRLSDILDDGDEELIGKLNRELKENGFSTDNEHVVVNSTVRAIRL